MVYLCGSNVITRVLLGGRRERQRRRCDNGSRGQRERFAGVMPLVCLWKKRPWAKEAEWPLEAGKGVETDSLTEPSEGTQACSPLDFSPGRPVLDFWPPEL